MYEPMHSPDTRPQIVLPPEQAREGKRLARLIEHTNSNLIVFALFEHIEDKTHIVELLKEMLAMPMHNVPLSGEVLNPLEFLKGLAATPRQVVNFTFVGKWQREGDEPSELEKLTGYLNIQREGFSEQPHAAIFWLTEAGLYKVMTLAPDFWSWQSGGVFDFAGVSGNRITQETVPTHVLSEEAAAQYRQALKEAKEGLDEHHLVYRKLINEFSKSLYEAGHYKEAEQLLRQAIEISKATLGEMHPEYAIRLNNLAELLRATGKYQEAEPLYRQAIEIDKVTLGEMHPEYAIRLNNLALLLVQTKRAAEALPLLEQSHAIFLKALGEDHPHTKQLASTLPFVKIIAAIQNIGVKIVAAIQNIKKQS